MSKENPYLDTPQSNLKTRTTTKDILDPNSEIEILARMEPPDGFEEDISFQSNPNNAIQLMLEQLSTQLRETRAQMTAQQKELNALKNLSPELEVAAAVSTPSSCTSSEPTRTSLSKPILTAVINSIPLFDATTAAIDANMIKSFLFGLATAFQALQISEADNLQCTSLLLSKMAPNPTTTTWVRGIMASAKPPTSIAMWKEIINRDFRPADLTQTALRKLLNLTMQNQDNLLTYMSSYRQLMVEAKQPSTADYGIKFVASLNNFWWQKLQAHHRFVEMRSCHHIEQVFGILSDKYESSF
jgi:hypothetical protein